MTTTIAKIAALLTIVLLSISSVDARNNENNQWEDTTQKVFASAIATPVVPAQKQVITLDFGATLTDAQLTICNNTGEVVKTIQHINGAEVSIDRSSLGNEVYYFTLTDQQQNTVVGKLVIQ